MAETIVTLMALAPFIVGIPLLGKQLDIKQKTYDATRYSAWERTVWRSDGMSNRKSEEDITLEARDRTLGSLRAAVIDVQSLRNEGITENPLWRDRRRQRLLDYQGNDAPVAVTHREQPSPVEVGYQLVPGIAYGNGLLGEIQRALRLDSLNLTRRSFAGTSVEIGVRPVLRELTDRKLSLGDATTAGTAHEQIVQVAAGAILSDTWMSRDENSLRQRIDDVTVNELVEQLELPARPIGLQALGKGRQLYGEGQYGWDPDLRPRSSTLPAAYIEQR
ncbi:MAG TPA: hypothetical protein VIT67_00810 [Povalibacter sp.]